MRQYLIRLVAPHTHRGIDLMPGAIIRVPEARLDWFKERGLAIVLGPDDKADRPERGAN